MSFPDLTGHFHPVLEARQLGRSPVRIEVGGVAYALFRDHRGTPAALLDRCAHRHAPLSRGSVSPTGRLTCPYHGWNYDPAGHGRSPSQPTLKRCDVPAFQLVERWGWLWIAAQATPIAAFPVLDLDGWDLAGGFTTTFAAPLHVAFDNFSEDEHTPWVHGFLGWPAASASRIEFHAENHDDRTEVSYAGPQRPSPWLPALMIRRGDVFHNAWVSRFSPVHTVYTLHWTDPRTGRARPVRTRIAIFFVPETDGTTQVHTFVFVRIDDRRLALLSPVIRRIAMIVARNEVNDDARFIPTVADTPFELRGMRLGKYDKPLIHNHRLLESRYLGRNPRSLQLARP